MRWLLLLSLLFVALIFPSSTRADLPTLPHDYTKVTPGGAYIFVMLTREKDYSADNQAGTINKDETIRKTYPESGLYLNDGSTTPLWTIDWYAFDVEVSSDGHSLVKWGPWPSKNNYDELALAFYTDGKEVRSYAVDDLVARPQTLPESVSHYQWLDYANSATFDDQRQQLSLETLNGERYVFDVRSGEIVQKEVAEITAPKASTVPSEGVAGLDQGRQVATPFFAMAVLAGGLLVFFTARHIKGS